MIGQIQQPIKQEEEKEQFIISLKDLDTFGQAEKELGIGKPIFIQYFSKQKNQSIKLRDASFRIEIRIPARRTSCIECIQKKLPCSECKFCKEEICCRSWKCIYDLEHWKSNNRLEEYQSCACLKQAKNPKLKLKGQMQIDFRLLSLIEKIRKPNYQKYEYMLIKTGDAYRLQQETAQEDSPTQINRVFYQSNFGCLQQTENEKDRLGLFNSKTIGSMFKQAVKNLLTIKPTWEVSNLEQQCEQIIDEIITKAQMLTFKKKLQESYDINDYVNQPSLHYRGKQQGENATSNIWNSLEYSASSNPSILYFYLDSQSSIVVKNASYSHDDPGLGIRTIPISDKSHERGIWFKDRRGDIYSIHGTQLDIYKYHLGKKAFSRIPILNNDILSTAREQQCLIYVSTTDRVYYFNSRDFTASFYIALKRDNAHSVQNAKIVNDIFINDKKIRESSNDQICYAMYVMEDVKYRDSTDNERNDLMPVIYLLYHRSNMKPLPLSVYRLVHASDNTLKVSEFKMDQQSVLLKEAPTRVLNNFHNGLFFPMKIDGAFCVHFYSELDKKPTLMSGKLKIDTKHIDWNDQNLEFSNFTEFKYQDRIKIKPQFAKLLNKMSKYYISPGASRNDSITINDMAGCSSNNAVIHYLGYISSQEQPIEFMLTNMEGELQWKLFNIC